MEKGRAEMLNITEIVDKLHKQPEEFHRLMQEKRYCAAKWCFYMSMATAIFIEMDAEWMERMFGESGQFNEAEVRKAFREAGGDGADRPGDSKQIENTGGDIRPSLQEKGLLICTSYGMPDFLVDTLHGTY